MNSSLAAVGKRTEDVAKKQGKVAAGPGTACTYAVPTQQFCNYYGCEVPCPADNVCPSSIGCQAGQLCACGQNGETVACPAYGICPGKLGLMNSSLAAVAKRTEDEAKKQV